MVDNSGLGQPPSDPRPANKCNRWCDCNINLSTKNIRYETYLPAIYGTSITSSSVILPIEAQDWSDTRRLAHIHTVNEGLKLQKDVWYANHQIHCEMECLPKVSQLYRILFERTKEFTATLGRLLCAMAENAPRQWAETACMAIDWSIHVLHDKRAEFDKFLHSQRESIYWMLDETLLRFLVDQWDNTSSKIPWDEATAPLRSAISRGESLMPAWAEQDYEAMRKWNIYSYTPKECLEEGYFRRSRRFLYQSTRIYELWRTMRLWAHGQLPAELMNAIVEDVSSFENLPLQDLRTLYFPKGKGKAKFIQA